VREQRMDLAADKLSLSVVSRQADVAAVRGDLVIGAAFVEFGELIQHVPPLDAEIVAGLVINFEYVLDAVPSGVAGDCVEQAIVFVVYPATAAGLAPPDAVQHRVFLSHVTLPCNLLRTDEKA